MPLSAESKRNIVIIILVLILGIIWLILPKNTAHDNFHVPLPEDPRNLSYKIEGKQVAFTNGQAQDGQNIYKIFEANAKGDINDDGRDDTAVILTADLGGSGTFYYVSAALVTDGGYIGSNGVLIGDRIAPQATEIKNGLIIVNYADRKPGEPFTTQPSVGKSLYVQYSQGTLIARPEAIQVTQPYPYEKIDSPLKISGQARGTWFFEASFPVVLTDWDGKIIAQGVAKARDDWMTENFVPFTAELNFTESDDNPNGLLILKKDNPSGLPQSDAAYEIPVIFK